MSKLYKVKPEWFRKKDKQKHLISSWCKQKSDTEVACIICDKTINCEKKGFAALTQHAETKVHDKNALLKLSDNQLLLKPRDSGCFSCSPTLAPEHMANENFIGKSTTSTSLVKPSSGQIGLFNSQEACARAELIWAMKSVACNMSPAACDDLKDIFSAMFPNAVPDSFTLGRTKLSYLITEALGPHFYSKLLDDIKRVPYTLLYDETTNHSNQKELQIAVRFWSNENNEVVNHHLKTVFLGHATATDIAKQILTIINEAGLTSNNLLMLGSDGPKVNKKVWRLINSEVFDARGKSLIDIGTCNIHVIHNAFLKGVEEYGETASELIVDVYTFFKKFPSRWEDFVAAQTKTKCENKCLIKHTSTRWLTMGPAAGRLLAQWPAILDYFFTLIPTKQPKLMQSEKYKRITKSLKYVDIKIELQFITESAELFESFLKLFQTSAPLIHILYTEVKVLLKKIAGRIFKQDINLNKPYLSEYLLPVADIYCSQKVKDMSVTLKISNLMNFKHKMQNHYLAAFNYIHQRILLDSGDFLLNFQCLQLAEVTKKKSVKYVCNIAKALSFLDINEMKVRDEWLILQTDFVQPEAANELRIDHVWGNIIDEKSAVGELRYPNLASLLKASLTLSHGNSDVERGFSISQRVLSKEKVAMSEKMLNARLNIRDGIIKFKNVSKVPIDKKLLNRAYSANKSYFCFLEEQKILKEQKTKEAKKNEEEKRKLEVLEKEVHDKKGIISEMECKAKVFLQQQKDIQSSADSLLKEGNDRLKKAIEKQDQVQVHVSQEMLAAAERLRRKERELEKQTNELICNVQKRKSSLIDFLSNNPNKRKKLCSDV